MRFRTFAQGREITRKEFDQSKTLQEWGLKDLEAIMIQVQERVKEEPAVKKISPCEQWVLTRFNDLHKLLSGESRTAYLISMFLIQRPHPSAFVDRLRNPDTPWEEMFSSVFPWDMHYALMVLHECVEQYKQGVPEFRWVGEFGEKHHARIVELVEWFSHPRMADTPEWPFCVIYAVCILVGFIQKGLSFLLLVHDRLWIFLDPIATCRATDQGNVEFAAVSIKSKYLPRHSCNGYSIRSLIN